MKKYFNKYNSVADYETASPKWPEVSYIEQTDEVKYETKPIDYSKQYFTTVALGSGNISLSGSNTANTFSYSTDEGATWSTPAQVNTVTVSNGDKVMWKGTSSPNQYYGIGRFTTATTANFNAEGNAMSLLYGDNFVGQTDLTNKPKAFLCLFLGNTHVVSAENLSLPATTLSESCYDSMFSSCTNLTTAPELPATTLTRTCYLSMFAGCTNLTTAPELPATTLAEYCYQGMFEGCTSLTTAPELPATTLANNCYNSMFKSCTHLTTAPELPATTLTRSCYDLMFSLCTSLTSIKCLATDISAMYCTDNFTYNVAARGTFTKAASMNDWTTGTSGIPRGWTVVDA